MKFVKGRNFAFFMTIIYLLFVLTTFAQVDPNCNYEQSMSSGVPFFISNNEYPNNYGGNVDCQWKATSPPNTFISINCSDMSIPSSPGCTVDRLIINKNGLDVTKGNNYCSYGELMLESTGNQVSFRLVSSSNSKGGRFQCLLEAIPVRDSGFRPKRRIVGGVETGVNEFPFMAAIIILPRPSVWCGAAIISHGHALTATHCIHGRNHNDLALLVGEHDYTNGKESSHTELLLLAGYKVHPKYDTDNYPNDIAIVETAKRIDFSLSVGAVSLPHHITNTFLNQPVTLLGWGTDEFTGTESYVLMAVNVTVISNTECQSKNRLVLYPSQICTFGQKKDACQYDSGGPVVWKDPKTRLYEIVGIISYGQGCGSPTPSVNTRVTDYLSWIRNNI